MNRRKVGTLWFIELVLLVFVAGCGWRQKLPAPSLKSISPRSASPGQTVVITLKGTGFVYGPTINVSRGRWMRRYGVYHRHFAYSPTVNVITAHHVEAVNTTTITARFAIAANAVPGPVNISVSAYGVTTNAVTFTIARP